MVSDSTVFVSVSVMSVRMSSFVYLVFVYSRYSVILSL